MKTKLKVKIFLFCLFVSLTNVIEEYERIHNPYYGKELYGTDEDPTPLGQIERERMHQNLKNSIRDLENSINFPRERIAE